MAVVLYGCIDRGESEALGDVERAYQEAASCISQDERMKRTYDPISRLLCGISERGETDAIERLSEAKKLLDDEYNRIHRVCLEKRWNYIEIAPSDDDIRIKMLQIEFLRYSSPVNMLKVYVTQSSVENGNTWDVSQYPECRIAVLLTRVLTGEVLYEVESCDEIIQQVCG